MPSRSQVTVVTSPSGHGCGNKRAFVLWLTRQTGLGKGLHWELFTAADGLRVRPTTSCKCGSFSQA